VEQPGSRPDKEEAVPVKVAVCVKQVPDPSQPPALDPATRTLVREGKVVMDDADGHGVELGLQLTAGGGEVVVVSMAPGDEVAGLRPALAMGAAGAVLVSDPALAGSDALGTAKVLAAVLRRIEPDLVVTATESTDGYTGTVPAQVAELLGLPMVTFAKHVELAGDGAVKVQRQTEAGYDEVTCALPAVVSVTTSVAQPRYPSFKGIVAAKSKPIERLTLADLGLDAGEVGQAGARQEIVEVRPVEQRSGGEIVTDEGDAHERIVALLADLKVISR
jgi:electron transfer flavoprotein beta subunit